jgi:hypothetical protein
MVAELEEEFDPGEIAAGFAKIATEATAPRSAVVGASPDVDGAKPETGMARLYIGAGRRDGLRPADVVGAIANETGLPGKQIGAIDIFQTYTFVEVPADRRDEIIRVLANTTIKGSRVRIDVAPSSEEPARPRRFEPDRGATVVIPDGAPAAIEDGPPRSTRRPPPSWDREARGEAPPRRATRRREEPIAPRRRGDAPPWLRGRS